MNNTPKDVRRVEEIISSVSGVGINDLYSRSRKTEVCEARQVVWLIAKDMLGHAYFRIARMYGMDHSTVIHGVNKMRADGNIFKIKAFVEENFKDLQSIARENKGRKRVHEWGV